MNRFAALVAIALLGSLTVASAQPKRQVADEKPRFEIADRLPSALKAALKAYGKIRYSGSRIVEFKSGPDRQRHVEYVITDGFRSRVEFPDDSPLRGQVIVETPKERRHFTPKSNEIHVLPPRREEAFGRIANMAKRRFRFTQSGGGSIAGLSTQLVSISDPQGNVLQKLWIDPKSGMVLKREVFDRGGALQGFFEFQKVDLTPNIDPSEFRLQPKGARVVTPNLVLNRLIRKGSFQDVRLTGTSYHLESAKIQNIGGRQVLVQLYLGDGHRISLYQLAASIDPAKLDKLAGALNTYAWQRGESTFALVGDLTDAELRTLARRLGA